MNPNSPPSWVISGGTILLGALLAFHVIYDAFSDHYQNPTLSLALLGAFGMALGFKKSLRDGDDK